VLSISDSFFADLPLAARARRLSSPQALATHFHIVPERLSADPFGASRPVETNDTLEGRARKPADRAYSRVRRRRIWDRKALEVKA
jgi:hypothetical protein